MNIARLVKMVILAGLLTGAGYFLGSTYELIYQQHALILSPSKELLFLFLRFLLAVGAIALTGGLVAVLVRPLWATFIAFLFSGLAMLLAWELRLETGILAAIYVLASVLYSQGIISEMDNRVKFSLRPISESQPILLLALAVLASASLYLGYKAEIEQEGFSLPPSLKDSIVNTVDRTIETQLEPRLEGLVESQLENFLKSLAEGQVGDLQGGELEGLLGGQLEDLLGVLVKGQMGEKLKAQMEDLLGGELESLVEGQLKITPEIREKAKEIIISQFRAQKETFLDQFRAQFDEQFTKVLEEMIKPYERFIPIVLAIFLFQPLFIITRLLGPLPVWILRALFPLLGLLRITKVVTETREVQRLSLG